MQTRNESAGPSAPLPVSAAQTGTLPSLPLRAGQLTVAALIDLYMAHYAGRDPTRLQRLTWWTGQIGPMQLDQISDDHVHAALETLARQSSRFYAGDDAD